MKRFILPLVLSLFVSACTFSVDIDGHEVDCIGIGETQNPNYHYEVKGWNIFWGVLFFQLLFIPPIVVASDAWMCPTHKLVPRREVERPIPGT